MIRIFYLKNEFSTRVWILILFCCKNLLIIQFNDDSRKIYESAATVSLLAFYAFQPTRTFLNNR